MTCHDACARVFADAKDLVISKVIVEIDMEYLQRDGLYAECNVNETGHGTGPPVYTCFCHSGALCNHSIGKRRELMIILIESFSLYVLWKMEPCTRGSGCLILELEMVAEFKYGQMAPDMMDSGKMVSHKVMVG